MLKPPVSLVQDYYKTSSAPFQTTANNNSFHPTLSITYYCVAIVQINVPIFCCLRKTFTLSIYQELLCDYYVFIIVAADQDVDTCDPGIYDIAAQFLLST